MWRRIISLLLSFGLLFQQAGFAQGIVDLNIGGYLSELRSGFAQDKFRPLHLRYFSYDNLNDNFKILLDKGDLKNLKTPELEASTKALLGYFLVGVALPDDAFWVNLRPDSEDQIIDPYLAQTDVGKTMLEADLLLKKDTAQMTSPATAEGREYWNKLYEKAADLYGYDNVTIPTLTRPWIVPGEIIVRESKGSAYVYKATLKVMLEQDYLKDSATYNFKDERSKALNEYSSQLIRELIIPKLTKEVNSSKRYASLRQVYYSLILSRWFKLRFTGKTGTYASLINTGNLANLTSKDLWTKTTYFKQYQKSFQDGEYNIKEAAYTPTGQVIRSYFSGGIDVGPKVLDPRNGMVFANDNAAKLGEVIEGKAVIDPQGINFKSPTAVSPIENSGAEPSRLPLPSDEERTADSKESVAERTSFMSESQDRIQVDEAKVNGYESSTSSPLIENKNTAQKMLRAIWKDFPPLGRRYPGVFKKKPGNPYGQYRADTLRTPGSHFFIQYNPGKSFWSKQQPQQNIQTSSQQNPAPQVPTSKMQTIEPPDSDSIFTFSYIANIAGREWENLFGEEILHLGYGQDIPVLAFHSPSPYSEGHFLLFPGMSLADIREIVNNPANIGSIQAFQRTVSAERDPGKAYELIQKFAKNNIHILDAKENLKLRQKISKEAIEVALRLVRRSDHSKHFKIGFNGWKAFASQNQLHLQSFFYEDGQGKPSKMPVETFFDKEESRRLLRKTDNGVDIYELQNYPLRGFVFQGRDISSLTEELFKAVRVMQDQETRLLKGALGVPHNIIFTKTQGDGLAVYLFPRQYQATSDRGIGVAFIEAGGELIFTDRGKYNKAMKVIEGAVKKSLRGKVIDAMVKGELARVSLRDKEFKQLKEAILYVPGKTLRFGLRNRFPNGGFVYSGPTKGDIVKAEMKWIAGAANVNEGNYKRQVESLFTDEKTQEQIQAELLNLRRTYNPGKYNQEAEDAIASSKEINANIINIFNVLDLNYDRDIIIASILSDNVKQGTTVKEMLGWIDYMRDSLKIDDIDSFINSIRGTKEYVHIAGRNAGLSGDMELLRLVLKLWGAGDSSAIERLKMEGYKIYIVAKNERIAQDATTGDVDELLRERRYAIIQQAKVAGIVEIIPSGSNIVGTNLRAATSEFNALIEKAHNGKAALGIKGEENNFTVNGINAPHFRLFLAASRDSHIMTGVQWVEDSLIYDDKIPPVAYPIIINVPAGIGPAKDYFGMRQTRMEMKAFHQAREILNQNEQNVNWDSVRYSLELGPYRTLVEYVVDKYPQKAWHMLFDVYPGDINPGELSSKYRVYLQNRGIAEGDFSFFNFCKWLNTELKERVMSEVVGNGLGAEYDVQAYEAIYEYDAETANRRWKIAQFGRRADGLKGKAADTNTQQLVLRTILFRPDQYKKGDAGLKLDVIEAEDVLPGNDVALFYPDKALGNVNALAGRLPLISHTGGYFWPPTLKKGIDKNAPADYQRISKLNGIIDMRVRNGEISMLPVYSKGVLIINNDGSVQFARFGLGEGSLELEVGKPVEWPKVDVNPAVLRDVAVFTPMYINDKVGVHDDTAWPAQNRDEAYKLYGDNYKVGAGRFNIVLPGDDYAHIYYNAVYLQPEGVIISLSEGKFREIFKEKGKEYLDNVMSGSNTAADTVEKAVPHKIRIRKIGMTMPEGINLTNIKYLYGGLTFVWDAKKKQLPQNLLNSIHTGSQLPEGQYKRDMQKVEETVRENFRAEGWYNDISRLTQETQIQQILERGPRSYWVKTANNLMIVSAEGREDTAMGLSFPEAVYFAYQKLFDHLLKRHNGNRKSARREFDEEIKSLEILNFDGGSSVGLGSFIGVEQNEVVQEHLPILERCSGPANGKAGERPVPFLVVHSVKKQLGDIAISRPTLNDVPSWTNLGGSLRSSLESSSSPVKDEQSDKQELNEVMRLIRSGYYRKDDKIREAVKLIAEQGDDALKQAVVDIMYELATYFVPIDWDHAEQIWDGRIDLALREEVNNALFAIEMIRLIGGNIGIAKLEKLIEMWPGSSDKDKARRPEALEALESLKSGASKKKEISVSSPAILEDVLNASVTLVISNEVISSVAMGQILDLFNEYLQELKISLQRVGVDLEKYITINDVINGIRADRGKASKKTKFVKKLKGEIADVVDENDAPVAVTEAGFTHIFGLRHRTSNVFVFTPDGKLLLQRRVHNKAEAKTFSIAGGHVVHNDETYADRRAAYAEAAEEEVLQEFQLNQIEQKLERDLILIGDAGQFQNDDDRGPNNEFRSLYAYIFTEREWEHVNRKKDAIDAERAKRTEQEFEKWIEDEQKRPGGGLGEVWGYHILDLPSIKNAESVRVAELYSDGLKPQDVPFSSDLLLPLIRGTAPIKAGTVPINPIEEIERKVNDLLPPAGGSNVNSASSPVTDKAPDTENKRLGGIDLRALPMTIQPMGSFSGLNFKLPQLSQASLEQINIKEEIRQIKNMAQAGIIPSGERIKEFIAACVQKGETDFYTDTLLLCLADILKKEEENASESSPELREALAIADTISGV